MKNPDHAAPYEVRVSARRTKTMTAFREDGKVVVVVPARMPAADRASRVPALVSRLLAKEVGEQAPRADHDLTERARQLWDAHLRNQLGDCPRMGVRWVTNQTKRWGSNTVSTGEIRLSSRLRVCPGWVVDAVLVHELVHFSERQHTPRFWQLAANYPHMERARGFLDALEHFDAHGWPSW